MSQEHDQEFIRNFSVVVIVLTVFAFVIYGIANAIHSKSVLNNESAIAERVQPFGSVNLDEPFVREARDYSDYGSGSHGDDSHGDSQGDSAAPMKAAAEAPEDTGEAVEVAAAHPGEGTYNQVCVACHGNNLVGAPMVGDTEAWAPRFEKGVDMLVSNAINGYQGENGVMPAKGGLASLTDDQVREAVYYMIEESGGAELVATGAAPAEPEADSVEPAAAEAEPSDDAADETTETAQVVINQIKEMVQAEGTPTGAPTAAEEATEAAGMDGADGEVLAMGKGVYDTACFICHAPGAAGAPKFGDVDAWADRIAKGSDVLYDHAVNGFMGNAGLMPAKGGRVDLSDEEVRAAVDYMVAESR